MNKIYANSRSTTIQRPANDSNTDYDDKYWARLQGLETKQDLGPIRKSMQPFWGCEFYIAYPSGCAEMTRRNY